MATRPRVEGVAGRGIRQRVYNHQKRNEVVSLLSEDEKKTTSLNTCSWSKKSWKRKSKTFSAQHLFPLRRTNSFSSKGDSCHLHYYFVEISWRLSVRIALSYRTSALKIELELSVVSDRGVILGCVWVITVITHEAYLAHVIPTETCPFCVLWTTLPCNFPESTLSVNIMDCSTTPLSILNWVYL